jgi:outer membrane protein OmpA-like peptidoglycan-associated protein
MTHIIFKKTGMQRRTRVLFLLMILIFSTALNAQTSKKVEDLYADAKKQFATKNYAGTIKTCNQILSADPVFKDAHLLLADVYSNLDSVNLEILHLNKAGEIGREWEVVFRLGEAHYKNGDYPEALRYYNIYSDYKYIPEKRQFLLACKMASCKFAIQSINNPDKNSAQNNLNSDEFWPVALNDGKKLVFARVPKDPSLQPGRELYMVIPDSAIWQISKAINDTVVFDNEGVQTLADGTKMIFFTACNRPGGMGDCDIYFVKFENGKWGEPLNAGNKVNSEKWEGDPSFSAGSRMLYFSSERSGGKGKKDIWKAELNGFSDDGQLQWKELTNVGSLVNTTGNEISPYIYDSKRKFYFASDGQPGMGGMDLYSADIDISGNITNLRNMGYPINTHYDDDGLALSYVCDTMYFASSRQTEKGMEIFAFNLDRGLATTPMAYVKVKVKDMKTKRPVQTTVKLESQPFQNRNLQMQETGESGEAMFALQLNRNYAFTISEPGYLYYSKFVNQGKVNTVGEPDLLDVELEPIEIGAEVQLYNIYYETDSFRILPQSEPELQNLVTFLKNNSQLKIEIQGHTDSSGSAQANQVLSERRAKSVVDYLTGKGIQGNRLKWSGYGDKVPIASNETVEGRTLNRRTTIKILEK